MCFATQSIRDENYKNKIERDGEMERRNEKKGERTLSLDTEGTESASRRINREPAEILPVLDPLIVKPEGANQEIRCLRNSQIVLYIYCRWILRLLTRHLVDDQAGFR